MPTLHRRLLSEALDELRLETAAEIATGAKPAEAPSLPESLAFRNAGEGQLVGEKYGNMHLMRGFSSSTPEE